MFDGFVIPIMLHGTETWRATRQIGHKNSESLTIFGSQERDPTKQVHRSLFRRLFSVRASTPGFSIFGKFGRLPLLADKVGTI
jgi:hypothetical protein